MNTQDDSTCIMTKHKRYLQVDLDLSEAREEVEDPDFLLVREAQDKRSRNKRSPFKMEIIREHLMKRDPGYIAWTSVTKNMDVLQGHLNEKLFAKVARQHEGCLGNIGQMSNALDKKYLAALRLYNF